jgi:hypothetical protein
VRPRPQVSGYGEAVFPLLFKVAVIVGQRKRARWLLLSAMSAARLARSPRARRILSQMWKLTVTRIRRRRQARQRRTAWARAAVSRLRA